MENKCLSKEEEMEIIEELKSRRTDIEYCELFNADKNSYLTKLRSIKMKKYLD